MSELLRVGDRVLMNVAYLRRVELSEDGKQVRLWFVDESAARTLAGDEAKAMWTALSGAALYPTPPSGSGG